MILTKKVEAQPSMRSLIIVAVLAVGFSSFTLWLIEPWIKYPLFVFEIFAIIILYLIVIGYNTRIFTKQTRVGNVNISLIIDLFLMVSAFSLLVFNVLKIEGGLVQPAFALLCTSLLSGHALLNIFGLTCHFSKLENLILSYMLSYTYTGLIALVSLPINQDARALVTLSSFILVGLISALKHKRSESSPALGSFSENLDFLALIVAVTFYTISFCFMYPSFGLLPYMDTARHYASSVVLGRTPDIYIGSTYLLAHLHESTFLTLSNSPLISAQTALVMLNLMLPLAFYIMAKPYLEKIDARLPSLATVFWVLFTNSFGGFAWLYFTNLKLSTIGQTQLQILVTTADKSYNGTIYGILGLWYVPAFVSLAVLMATISLMSKKEIPTSKYLALFSIFIAVLYLTHVTEAVIFALFLTAYGVISRNEFLRIDDSIKSSIIGFLFVIVIYYILSLLTPRFIIDLSLLISLIGPISTLLLSSLFRRYIRPRLSSFRTVSRINNESFWKRLVLALFFAYAVALLSWSSLTESFHTWQVDSIGLVPWLMYPLMLGINGLLALISLYYITRNKKSYAPLMLFIAFMIFSFIAGKFVSAINLYFFNAGYWEKRFMWLIKLFLATLAPIPVVCSIDRLKEKNIHVNIKTVASVTMIGTVVLYGVSTTFLNLEYWNIQANNPASHPSPDEMEAIDALKEIFDDDHKTWLATVTGTSASRATFAAPADQLGLKQLLYAAYTPEMAFTQLYRHPAYSHAYIYLHNRDVAHLKRYGDRFLMQYLTMLPVVFENSEVNIYNVSKLSFPQPNSENVLVVRLDRSIGEQNLHKGYSILSHGFYNYTVAYDLDDKSLDASTVILAFDPPEENTVTGVLQDEFNQTLGSWSVSEGSWRIEDGKLVGGETGRFDEGIILLPTFAENFTAAFKVEMLSGDATVLNYVSLVYSWIDSKNYRIADVLFGSDTYVYVLFRTFVNGVETALPKWPGIKTDLTWDFGDEYNITVTVNGTLNEISINNKTFLSTSLGNNEGKVGLRYYRFNAVSFDDFSVAYATQISLRPVKDYLDYLRSSGKIIVLNTNGYGFFGEELFLISNSTMNVEKIEGQSLKVELPYEVSVPVTTRKKNNTTVLSRYTTSLCEIPFISHQSYDSGELFYVNAYPIIKAMQKSSDQSSFYEILGKLLEDLNLTKLNPDAVALNFDGYVKEIRLSNDVEVETTSLLFPLKLELKQVDVEAGNRFHTFYNVTNIALSEYSRATVEVRSATIQNGNGFYADFEINSTFSVKPADGSLKLKIAADDESFNLIDVSSISIAPSSTIELLTRTPTVSASEATFVEFHPQGSLQWRTRTYGQNLMVTGSTKFSITVSDSYSTLENVELGSSFQRDPPIVTFDLLSTLPTAVFWCLLLLPIFVSILFIFTFRESHRKSQTTIRKSNKSAKSI